MMATPVSPSVSNTTDALQAQMAAMAEKLGVPMDQLQSMATSLQSLGGGAQKKAKRVHKEVAQEDRCMARVWGKTGCGTCQCSKAKVGGDYCKQHAKQAMVTEEPCQSDGNGNRMGLWCGRIDQELKGQGKDGKWQIIWNNEAMQKLMEEERAAGTFVFGDVEQKKHTKSTSSKPRVPKAKKEKKGKAPKPKRGTTAYFFYLSAHREAIKAEIKAAADGGDAEAQAKLHKSGTVKVAEVTKVAGARWKALSGEEKAPFETMAAEDKAKKLSEFESTTVAEEKSATVTAATPPTAPATADVLAAAAVLMKAKEAKLEQKKTDEELLEMLQTGDDEEDAPEDQGPWNYTTPDGTAAAVERWGDDHVVVPFSWYEENDEACEEEWRANSIGNVTGVSGYPEEDDEDIEGTFVAKA
mgnify:CR=1 FL=1